MIELKNSFYDSRLECPRCQQRALNYYTGKCACCGYNTDFAPSSATSHTPKVIPLNKSRITTCLCMEKNRINDPPFLFSIFGIKTKEKEGEITLIINPDCPKHGNRKD